MREILNYDIHGILKFQIVRSKKHDFLRDLNLMFSYFEVEEVKDPEVILNIGKFTPSNEDCYIVDHRYYIKENYLYCRDFSKNAKWEVEIIGLNQKNTIINFHGNISKHEKILYPNLLSQQIILQPLIEYKLNEKDYHLIHSAAISKNNQGYLLAGRPGAFKSTLAIDFIREANYSFLADDRVIISHNRILSFPMNYLSINFKFMYLKTEEFQNFVDKINFVRYHRKTHNFKKCKMPIAKSSTLKELLFITKTNRGAINKRVVGLEEAIHKLVENNKSEMILLDFYKYMLAYSFVFPDSKVAKYWKTLAKNLNILLRKISIYEIEIPQKYNSSVFKGVCELL